MRDPAASGALSRRWISPYGGGVVGLVLAYGLLFSWLSILKHQTWHSYFWDLGVFDHVIWNTAQGRFLESSPYGFSYLGEHLSLMLAAFAPLYWIWSDVRLLLMVQSFYMAAGAWPIYLLARKSLQSEMGAVLFGAAFLLFPNMAYVNLFDFHPETMLVLLLPWAIYFLHENRNGPFLAVVGLSLLVKEDVALILLILGLYAALMKRKWLLGIGLSIFALAWFVVAIYWVVPYFRGMPYSFVTRFAHLGSSPTEIALNLITNPLGTLGLIFSYEKLYYLFQLLSPVAFLPLLNPALAATVLPILAGNLLSNFPAQYSIVYQYSISMGPIFFAAAIGAVAFLSSRVKGLLCQDCYARNLKNIHLALAVGVFLFSLYGAGRDNAISYYVRVGDLVPRPNHATLEEVKALIPRDEPLAASNRLGAHFSQRRYFFYFPYFADPGIEVKYILADATDWTMNRPGGIRGELARLAPLWQYEVLIDKDDIVLLKRR